MGYGKGKTEGGHKRGHSAMAYWVTHQEAKAEARKRRRIVVHRLERQARTEAGTASPHKTMQHLRLKDGAPDEPDTGNWDAICATPRIGDFFVILFKELAAFDLPEPVIVSDIDDPIRHVRTGCRGSKDLGAEVTVVDCPETSDFPMYCDWETFGLPGMKVKWQYALEKAGQLGHVAYRHRKLECTFDGEASQQRFAEIWRRVIGKTPLFEPA